MTGKPLPEWVALGTEVLLESGYRSASYVRGTVTRMSDTSAWVRTKDSTYERRFVASRWSGTFSDRLEEYGTGSSYHGSYAVQADSERGKHMIEKYAVAMEQQKLRNLWEKFAKDMGGDTDYRAARQLITHLDIYASKREAEVDAT